MTDLSPISAAESRNGMILLALWIAMMAAPSWWFESMHRREKKERENGAGRGR